MTPRQLLGPFLKRLGIDIAHRDVPLAAEATRVDRTIASRVRPYTMTGPDRLWALLNSVQYIVRSGIQGDIVECGVWRGGSVMAAAYKLLSLGEVSRDLWLYDTYTGMTMPSRDDIEEATGRSAHDLLAQTGTRDRKN